MDNKTYYIHPIVLRSALHMLVDNYIRCIGLGYIVSYY